MPDKSDFAAFISYAKADERKAHKIAELLERRGIKCWIAPRDVRPGAAYGAEIMRGIESSGAFILVLSSASNQSDFVAREVERAISMKKAVLPIRIENVEPSRSLQLFVSANQWIDAFSGKFASHIERVADRIAEQQGGELPPPVIDKTRPTSPWMWRTGAALAAVVALIALVLGWPSNRPADPNTPTIDPVVIDPSTVPADVPQVAERPIDLPSEIAEVPHDPTSGSAPAAADQFGASPADPWASEPMAGSVQGGPTPSGVE